MPDHLAAALAYLRRGWSVIPLQPGDKRPVITTRTPRIERFAWEEFQRRRPTEDEIRTWWGTWPEANIAIVTGNVSGLIVLDVDGPQGRETLQGKHVPETPVATTGKGWHYYYRHPGGTLHNFAGRAPGLDLRGDGGYVAAPPSRHPSGTLYEWAITPDDAPLAPPPEWLLELARAPAAAVEAARAESEEEWVARALQGVGEGERNATATRLAGVYLRRGASPAEVRELLLAWNLRNKPPMRESEIYQVVDSIARREAQRRQGSANFEIERICKLETRPPVYRVSVFGTEIRMEIEDLHSFPRFQRSVMAACNRLPFMKKAREEWGPYLDEVLATKLEVIAAPEEAGEEAVVWEATLQYLRTRATDDPMALAERRGVLREKGRLYFAGTALQQYLKHRRIDVTPAHLWDLLRRRGAEDDRKRIRDPNGKTMSIRVWSIDELEADMAAEEAPAEEPQQRLDF